MSPHIDFEVENFLFKMTPETYCSIMLRTELSGSKVTSVFCKILVSTADIRVTQCAPRLLSQSLHITIWWCMCMSLRSVMCICVCVWSVRIVWNCVFEWFLSCGMCGSVNVKCLNVCLNVNVCKLRLLILININILNISLSIFIYI